MVDALRMNEVWTGVDKGWMDEWIDRIYIKDRQRMYDGWMEMDIEDRF